MEAARNATRRLAAWIRIAGTQMGRPVDPSTARGPIRFKLLETDGTVVKIIDTGGVLSFHGGHRRQENACVKRFKVDRGWTATSKKRYSRPKRLGYRREWLEI